MRSRATPSRDAARGQVDAADEPIQSRLPQVVEQQSVRDARDGHGGGLVAVVVVVDVALVRVEEVLELAFILRVEIRHQPPKVRLQRGPAEGQVDAVFWRELQRRPAERRLRVQDAAVRLDFRGAVPHGRIRKKRRGRASRPSRARRRARGAAPAVGRGQRAGPPHALREDAVRRPPPYITVGEGRHGAVMHEEQSRKSHWTESSSGSGGGGSGAGVPVSRMAEISAQGRSASWRTSTSAAAILSAGLSLVLFLVSCRRPSSRFLRTMLPLGARWSVRVVFSS